MNIEETQSLINSDQLLLLDFYAKWCNPCKAMNPILGEVEAKFGKGVVICKIDVDHYDGLAMKYHVQSIPTFILIRQGKILWQESGMQSAFALEKAINKFVNQSIIK